MFAGVLGQCLGLLVFAVSVVLIASALDMLYRSGSFGAALRSAGTLDHITAVFIDVALLPACLVGGAYVAFQGRTDTPRETPSHAAVDAVVSTGCVIGLFLLMRFAAPDHRAGVPWLIAAFVCAAPLASMLGTFFAATVRAHNAPSDPGHDA
jgi:hypothetical protein